MSSATGRTSAKPAEAKQRGSSDIAAEIDALMGEKAAAEARLSALAASYDDAILKGDDAAEAHEAETMRVKRTLRRVDLRIEADLPTLDLELAAAHQREADEAAAEARAAAEQEIGVFMKCFPDEYREHADAMASLLLEFSRLEVVAKAAGVPSLNDRLRPPKPEVHHPGRNEIETFTVWIDPAGIEHENLPPPTELREGPDGTLRNPNLSEFAGWSSRTQRRTLRTRDRIEPAVLHPHILAQVRLPGLTPGEPSIFPRDRGFN